MSTAQTSNSVQTRRPGKCSLCQKTGHNIRSCTLYENVRRDSINTYMQYIYHCIVGFATKNWDYSSIEDEAREEDPYCKPDPKLLEIFQNALQNEISLDTILDKPLDMLYELDNVSLKALTYGYQIDFRAPRQDIIRLLHYMLVSEADYKWMHSYDTKWCVPYIVHSSTYLPVLENNNAKIFEFTILKDDSLVIASLYNLDFRRERLRTLYDQSRRILRNQNNELRRYDHRLMDLDRHLQRIERDITSVTSFRDTVSRRATSIRQEMVLFPEDIATMKSIKILQASHKIDQLQAKECPICYEDFTSDAVTKTNCGHHFCNSCILNTVVKKFDVTKHDLKCDCPLCRTQIRKLYGDKTLLLKELKYLARTYHISSDIHDSIG